MTYSMLKSMLYVTSTATVKIYSLSMSEGPNLKKVTLQPLQPTL